MSPIGKAVGVGKGDAEAGQIHNAVDDAWRKLNDMWQRVGYDSKTVNKRKSVVVNESKGLFTDMVEEQLGILKEKEKTLEALYQEMLQLLKDLTMDSSIALETKEKAKDRTLLQQEDVYMKVVEELRQKKAVRMEKYNKVNDKLVEITEELDEELFTIQFEGIPSDPQVAQIEKKLEQLRTEKARRQTLIKSLKKTVGTLFACVERIPKNEVERISLDELPEGLKMLSMKVVNSMEDLRTRLYNEVSQNQTAGDKMWQKIRELWSRLEIESEVTLAFENVHKSVEVQIQDKLEKVYKPTVLRGLQSEVEHLEEEKRKNMAKFIGQVRDELSVLWRTRLFMDGIEFRFRSSNYAELTDFTEDDYQSEDYTEELLEKHEREVEYWNNLVARNKKLIDGINKRERMFSQYRELDQKSADPSRLANRGGALLREEKERKMLEKAIPKLEAELKQLSDKLEKDLDEGHGMKKFLVYGQDVSCLIECDWQLFHEERDQRKKAKQDVGGKTMMSTQLGNRGMKRPGTPGAGLTPTPKKAKLPQSTVATPGGRTFSTPFGSMQSISTASSTKKTAAKSSKLPPKPPSRNPISDAARANKFIFDSSSICLKRGSNSLFVAARKIVRKSIGRSRKVIGSSLLSSTAQTASSGSMDSGAANLDQIGEGDSTNISSLGYSNHGSSNFGAGKSNLIVSFAMEEVKVDSGHSSNTENENFIRPATRSKFTTPAPSSTGGRKLPTSKIPNAGKPTRSAAKTPREQVTAPPPNVVVSPATSYSEFTEPLLCQSTLNSSAVSSIVKNRNPLSNLPDSCPPIKPARTRSRGEPMDH